jgi:hypothetical protein
MIKPFRFCITAVSLVTGPLLASEIREFDVKTLQRLGNELTRVSQTRDRGATTPERSRAIQSAKAALQGNVAMAFQTKRHNHV